MPSDGKSKRPQPPTKLAAGKYERLKKLGAGCFAEVFRGKDTSTNADVAVKIEDRSSSAPQLEKEHKMLRILQQPQPVQGFVEVFHYGKEEGYNIMVMELLGQSIEDRVQWCSGRFTPKTASLVATQLLHRIEYLHSKGIVHRDIKPENFVFGINGKIHHIYLIDFGLSKLYWDKKHSVMKSKLSLTGTARYASINAHVGVEQSRRDDLEAIGHMLMYFLRGSMPWSGLDARTKEEKYRKIMEKKQNTALSDLCAGYPRAFQEYLEYVRALAFTARPDYDRLQESFLAVQTELGVTNDWEFQWFESGPPEALVNLEPRQRILQPDDDECVAKENGESNTTRTSSSGSVGASLLSRLKGCAGVDTPEGGQQQSSEARNATTEKKTSAREASAAASSAEQS